MFDATSAMVDVDFSQLGTEPDLLSINEQACLGHVNIRGSSSNTEFTTATKTCLGVELPVAANTFIVHGDLSILWLSPDEWLVVMPAEQVLNFVSQLRDALGDLFASVNDVSGSNTVLELSGRQAQALLLKGCPLDLHYSVFSQGQCAQTVLAKAGITLWQTDAAPVYKLIVRRSFSDYLGLWLLDAAKEYAD